MNSAPEIARGTLLRNAVDHYHSLLQDRDLAALVAELDGEEGELDAAVEVRDAIELARRQLPHAGVEARVARLRR